MYEDVGTMIKCAQEIAQVLSEEVRRRAKNLKEFTIVEILEGIVDVLAIGLGKSKGLWEIKEEVRVVEEDLKDYVGKVVNKLDKLTAHI